MKHRKTLFLIGDPVIHETGKIFKGLKGTKFPVHSDIVQYRKWLMEKPTTKHDAQRGYDASNIHVIESDTYFNDLLRQKEPIVEFNEHRMRLESEFGEVVWLGLLVDPIQAQRRLAYYEYQHGRKYQDEMDDLEFINWNEGLLRQQDCFHGMINTEDYRHAIYTLIEMLDLKFEL